MSHRIFYAVAFVFIVFSQNELYLRLKQLPAITMKKVFALLFIGSTLTFAACQSKPKTEEAATTTTDSAMTTMSTDTTTMAGDSATSTTMVTTTESASAVADSAK